MAIMLIMNNTGNAQKNILTPGAQAILFAKIFSYVITIESGNVQLLVVYDEQSEIPYGMQQAFLTEKIDADVKQVSTVSGDLSDYNVIYFADESAARKFNSKYRDIKALLISGEPDVVEDGNAAIGIYLLNEKPRIIINLKKIESTGQHVSAELMELAQLIESS
jgi:hypothetical protein